MKITDEMVEKARSVFPAVLMRLSNSDAREILTAALADVPNVAPTAWMRGIKSPSTPHGPAEYDVDLRYGDDQPEGDGWVPLYRHPKDGDGWRPIDTAPTDGTTVLVYAAERKDVAGEPLPAFQSTAAYHEDAGWCVDELRVVTHWRPLPSPPIESPPNLKS